MKLLKRYLYVGDVTSAKSTCLRASGRGGVLEYRLVNYHYFVKRIKPYHFLYFKKSVLLCKCQGQFMQNVKIKAELAFISICEKGGRYMQVFYSSQKTNGLGGGYKMNTYNIFNIHTLFTKISSQLNQGSFSTGPFAIASKTLPAHLGIAQWVFPPRSLFMRKKN